MADLEISGSALVVHIRGVDKFLALASRLEIPLQHIASVEINPAEAHQVFHGLRMGGTNLPGVITAGRFLQHSGRSGMCTTRRKQSRSTCTTMRTRGW